jgi:hypothetical protein
MKKEGMENDRDRERWLGNLMRSPLVAAPDACISAETLAAWVEGALDARTVSIVELHASNCSRCAAALAAVERTTPPPEPPKPSWNAGALWRWLVPLTAAATAVAIWIAVPDRRVPQVQPTSAPQETVVPETQPGRSAPEIPVVEPPVPTTPPAAPPAAEPAPEPPAGLAGRRLNAPGPAERLQEPAAPAPEARAESARRQDAPREKQTAQAFSREAAPPSAAPVPPPAPKQTAKSEAVVAPAPQAGAAADRSSPSALATLERQQELTNQVPTSESTSLTNSQVRWRVMAWTSVERSIDAGKTWIKATPPPGVAASDVPGFAVSVVSVRAVDALRATLTTSDGREFYTTNGGISWQRLQGNSPAPF